MRGVAAGLRLAATPPHPDCCAIRPLPAQRGEVITGLRAGEFRSDVIARSGSDEAIQFVGWAKAAERRAHAMLTLILHRVGFASACALCASADACSPKLAKRRRVAQPTLRILDCFADARNDVLMLNNMK
jgi:hypothetical protein